MGNLNTIFKQAKSVQEGFDRLAQLLLNETLLEANGIRYEIMEVEFYYYNNVEGDSKEHRDNFTHCHEQQGKSDTLYFHDSGIDITFGECYENKDKPMIVGGALIRSIRKAGSGEEPITGPLKVRSAIIDQGYQGATDSLYKLSVRLIGNAHSTSSCFKSSRISLFSDDPETEKYIFKPYRYIKNDTELLERLLNEGNETHFLAWYLDRQSAEISEKKIKEKISDRLDYLKSPSFTKVKKKEKRESFLRYIDGKQKE